MKQAFNFLIILTLGLISITHAAHAQGAWTEIGATDNGASLLYYKLLQVNGAAHQYSTVIELSVQANPNFYNMQATYTIRVDKSGATGGRFDGLEVECISGNQGTATFYIYNDALWVRSNFTLGKIYYRTYGNFGTDIPLNTAPFGQTSAAPTGFAFTATGSMKCDFDNNVFSKLPVIDQYGAQTFYNNVSIFGDKQIGVALADKLTYDNKTQPHYGFQWTFDSWNASGYSYWLSGYGGIKMFTGGIPRLAITSGGNVGIGTTNPGQYKLAVEGAIRARRVKVDQESWADYVFEPEYKLPSLQEVEAFIKEHKHLPDVPSAEEVASEKLDLGEMNKILLQKIEELTLHLIEQDKRIEELEMKSKVSSSEVSENTK